MSYHVQTQFIYCMTSVCVCVCVCVFVWIVNMFWQLQIGLSVADNWAMYVATHIHEFTSTHSRDEQLVKHTQKQFINQGHYEIANPVK